MNFFTKLFRRFFPKEELLSGQVIHCDKCNRVGILSKSIKKYRVTVMDENKYITHIDLYLCRRHLYHEYLFY